MIEEKSDAGTFREYPDFFLAVDIGLNAFYQANDRYPTNEEGLEVLILRKHPDSQKKNPWQVFETLPEDRWGNPIEYRFVGEEERVYLLRSTGPPEREVEILSSKWAQVRLVCGFKATER